MAKFHFVQDRKCTIWVRDNFDVEADTKDEAIAKVKEAWKNRDTTCEDLEFETYDREYMYDTVENMTIADNYFKETSYIYCMQNADNGGYIYVCSNADDL